MSNKQELKKFILSLESNCINDKKQDFYEKILELGWESMHDFKYLYEEDLVDEKRNIKAFDAKMFMDLIRNTNFVDDNYSMIIEGGSKK